MQRYLGVGLFLIFSISCELHAQQVWLFLGDSIAEGYGVQPTEAFPHVVAEKLKGTTEIVVRNASVSGSTAASGLSRLKWQLKIKPKPTHLILELGANDALRGLDPKFTYQHLLSVIKLAKAEGMNVLLMGMRSPPNNGPKYAAVFNPIFPQLAKETGALFLPFFLIGVAGVKELNQGDGIHPNKIGQERIAQTLEPYLKKWLPIVSVKPVPTKSSVVSPNSVKVSK